MEVKALDGQKGPWKIETFTVSESQARFGKVRADIRGSSRYVPAGTYKSLKRGGTVVMTNTPDEVKDILWYNRYFKGDILINGLGLGIFPWHLVNIPEVNSVTVIEIDQDVIHLVEPHIKHPKLKVIHADCFEYTPPKGKRYDFVWHDIWDHISEDNLPEMKKLHRKYGRRCDVQKSWARELCERQKERNKLYMY